MAFKIVVLSALLSVAAAGGPTAYSTYSPSVGYDGFVGSSHESTVKGYHGDSVSQISKSVVSPYSSVSKFVSKSTSGGYAYAPTVSYAAPSYAGSNYGAGYASSYAAPAVSYAAPTVSYAAPTVSYAAPAVSYSTPYASSYHGKAYAAPVSYAAPTVSYGSPAVSYASPVVKTVSPVSYAAPSVSYAAPSVSYAAPALSYASPVVKTVSPLSYASPAVSYATPYASAYHGKAYAAPVSYASPVSYAAPAPAYGYSASPAVAHVTYGSALTNYAW